MTYQEQQPSTWRPGSCTCESLADGLLVYRLSGDLDVGSGETLAFDKPLDGFRAVVVDLADAGFFGSTALNALLRLRLDAEQAGIAVHLSTVPRIAARVFEVTGADTLFPAHPDLGAAVQALR
ncbi:STAS domain-containing protein [Streptacidiphilus anmyonensis]|uniref:STAS domain-containing protein n=1 Tax=Streptacidiphilus anmyonensis TaxID=405782 RepID=UPI000694E36E|nr:STAS domain-containing protein [Streptacidiphilus anmyonensis]